MRFKHFVGDFARLLYGAVHNLSNVTSRIHKCPQNRISGARPQHRELIALNTCIKSTFTNPDLSGESRRIEERD